jgi:outer membrane protein, heavy metal efflux system
VTKDAAKMTGRRAAWLGATALALALTAGGLGAQTAAVVETAAVAPAAAVDRAGQVLTEAEVVAAVLASNLGLRAAETGVAAAEQRPGQVRWPFPMVEVMPMVGMIADGDAGAQVMARQSIPWSARQNADRAARTRMAEAAAFEAEALGLDLVTMARTAYAQLWGVQEQASRLRDFITQLDLYREAALAQYAAGRGPQQAVLGIQVEGEVLAQRLEALAEDRAGLVARLEALAGGQLAFGPDDRVAPPPPPTDVPATETTGSRADVTAHPALEAGRAMQAAELSMAEMRRTMLRPEFTVGVNLNLSRMAFDRMYGQEPVMPAVGIMLPLWRGGVRAEVREAELRASQRELETADTRVALEAELDDALEQLARVQARIARYEDRLRPQIRQTLEASMAGYQAGTTRFLELLDAQRMALDVEMDLIMARVREAALSARLDAVTGRTTRDRE